MPHDLQDHLSPERLYVDAWTRHFLREHLDGRTVHTACNVGIGAGELDDWLGYWLPVDAELVSVDIDGQQVRALETRQARDMHPHPTKGVHGDLLQLQLGPFDLVTATGSTLMETGQPARALKHLRGWAPGGWLYVTFLHSLGDPKRLLDHLPGVEARATFDAMAGAELTAALIRG